MAKSLTMKLVKSGAATIAMGTATKVLGKTIMGPLSLAIGAYSSVKTFKTYMRNDPHNQLLFPLKQETDKWDLAITCIGREAYAPNNSYTTEDTGAIAALSNRMQIDQYSHLFDDSNLSYQGFPGMPSELHLSERYLENLEERLLPRMRYIQPNPEEARELIEHAVEVVQTTKDKLETEKYDKTITKLVLDLFSVYDKLPLRHTQGNNYSQIQQELSILSSKMKNLRSEYTSKIYKLEEQRDSRRNKYIVLAAASFIIGTISLPHKKISQ